MYTPISIYTLESIIYYQNNEVIKMTFDEIAIKLLEIDDQIKALEFEKSIIINTVITTEQWGN